jgi:hypothetical protein
MTEKEGYTKVITEINNTVGRCNRVGMGAADWVLNNVIHGLAGHTIVLDTPKHQIKGDKLPVHISTAVLILDMISSSCHLNSTNNLAREF